MNKNESPSAKTFETYRDDFQSREDRYLELGGTFDLDDIQGQIARLQQSTAKPNFWDDQKQAQGILKKISGLEKELKMWQDLRVQHDEVAIHLELLQDEGVITVPQDAQDALDLYASSLDFAEVRHLLSGPDDEKDAMITIHPGAGGTESQDWAAMLQRLYLRWIERHGYQYEILDFQPGDEAGIKEVTIEVKGERAYGFLKAEAGVHRLVRISPFDAQARRHTSFASVFVYPAAEDEVAIEINEKELRIDTYRASGAGGQHVNKTDSAVRLTHLPTGIVVQCQNERSQLKNKATAMKILKARLYDLRRDQQMAEKQKLEDTKMDAAWGSQIRSYVFQPYTMVKDHRTKEETGNIQAVMDGDIDRFLRAYLLQQANRSTDAKEPAKKSN
ncbi:MAG: peptide chain release factor 2 [Candidatus Marinimicrobia bacterium]|nr:peptide chain release factor 2 [Candidatus Neomarinimicrobiota bacterium]